MELACEVSMKPFTLNEQHHKFRFRAERRGGILEYI